MSAVPKPFTPNLADAELEAAIDIEFKLLVNAPNKAQAIATFDRFADLIRQRSPEMVAHIERSRGLRK